MRIRQDSHDTLSPGIDPALAHDATKLASQAKSGSRGEFGTGHAGMVRLRASSSLGVQGRQSRSDLVGCRTPIPAAMDQTKPIQPVLCLLHRSGIFLAGISLLLGGCSAAAPAGDEILERPSMASVRLPAVGTDPHMRSVRALASADFAVRTQAARALVRAGTDALPALGQAGDLLVPVPGGLQVSATRSVVTAILADATPTAVEGVLDSPWPPVRRAAAEEIGARDLWSAIPRLLEHLDDDSGDVRAASAASLRRLTNQWFGYRSLASIGHRRSAAQRWRHWWSQEGSALKRDLGPRAALVGGG